MFGPTARGHLTGNLEPAPFKHLRVGERYRVVREFVDHDGDLHAAGESWWFLGHHFVPYHDGLSLFVSLDQRQEWQIRLQWAPEAQAAFIDRLEIHIQPLSAPV